MTRTDLRPGATLSLNGHREIKKTSTSSEEAYYYYPDADGNKYLRVKRTPSKDFYQQHYDHESGKWENGLGGREPVLYNLPKLLDAPKDQPVFVSEGEKDADRLKRLGLLATTSPMGAGKWRPGYADYLRDFREIYVLADNDEAGRKHAEQVAATILGAKIVRLPDLPEKGDVSDWLNAGHTPEELLEIARRAPQEATDAAGRVLLGEAIREGIEPPETLVDDVLLVGKAHSIYGPPGLGKTFLMLWLILWVIERGYNVVLFDAENGARIIAERLQQLGADPDKLDEHLHYFPFKSLPTTEAGRLEYVDLLEAIRPALVCLDSWISFLAANGLDENSSNGIATFAEHYIAPARSRSIATLLLDHVPHEGQHARGSTRKKDELDVVWSLHGIKPFDRETIGEIELRRVKDREAWLDQSVRFAVGGDSSGKLVFSRTAATLEGPDDDELTPSERKALQALETFGEVGATASEWQKSAEDLEVKRRTFFDARRRLQQKNLILQDKGKRYKPSATKCNSSAMHQTAPAQKEVQVSAPPYRGAPIALPGELEERRPLSDEAAPGEMAGLPELQRRREQRQEPHQEPYWLFNDEED